MNLASAVAARCRVSLKCSVGFSTFLRNATVGTTELILFSVMPSSFCVRVFLTGARRWVGGRGGGMRRTSTFYAVERGLS